MIFLQLFFFFDKGFFLTTVFPTQLKRFLKIKTTSTLNNEIVLHTVKDNSLKNFNSKRGILNLGFGLFGITYDDLIFNGFLDNFI